VSGRALIVVALAVSVALLAAYVAAGGGDYRPTEVADPCQPRDWESPEGIDEAAEQFTLSALDGAACELQVSRETLALALTTPEAREEFAADHAIDDAELERAVRAGLARAIDDAERAGALSPPVAAGLRAIAARLPVDEGIALIEDASELFDGTGGVLDDLSGALDQAGELLP
jgi:hypothetical protein